MYYPPLHRTRDAATKNTLAIPKMARVLYLEADLVMPLATIFSAPAAFKASSWVNTALLHKSAI